jgi:hypothetical protein
MSIARRPLGTNTAGLKQWIATTQRYAKPAVILSSWHNRYQRNAQTSYMTHVPQFLLEEQFP